MWEEVVALGPELPCEDMLDLEDNLARASDIDSDFCLFKGWWLWFGCLKRNIWNLLSRVAPRGLGIYLIRGLRDNSTATGELDCPDRATLSLGGSPTG